MNIKKLIKKYPFIEIDKDCTNDKLTWLDYLDPGWNIALGDSLCSDLKKALIEDNCLDNFKFIEIKEKFGQLNLFCDGYKSNARKILDKYSELSKYICAHCGKPARYITMGWIYPLCEDCIKELNETNYKTIENFYKFDSYEDVLKEIDRIKNNDKI